VGEEVRVLRVGRLILETLRSARNRVLGVVVGVDTRQPLMALTFDDGPDPDTTPAILDVLARHRARATFFLIGRAAERYPAIVDDIVRSGHAIGHHTWDHVSLPDLPPAERRSQVAHGAKTMPPEGRRFFRPPYGHLDLASWWTVRRLGHDVVAWSDHIRDWHDEDADTFAARLREVIRPGAIVLLHDARQPFEAAADRPRHALARALDIVLSEAEPNLRFVTVPELLAAGRPTRVVRWRSAPASPPVRVGRGDADLAEGGP
jgi:peptidoglycan/xylan/chitin deacetylase (PgdA/CDA1 family)